MKPTKNLFIILIILYALMCIVLILSSWFSPAYAFKEDGRPLKNNAKTVYTFKLSSAPGISVGHKTVSALKQIEGLHERKHRKKLKSIVGVDPARVPWCGYAAAYAIKKAGKTPPKGYPRAASWKRYGTAVNRSSARAGDIAVIRTRRGHHVTIVSHIKDGRLYGIGGNQGNRVKVSGYRLGSVVSVRRSI